MSKECLMSGCQRKFSMENCKNESAHKVAKRNATKTPLKPRLRISIFPPSPGNRLLRIEQSGIISSTKVPPNLKQRESVKLRGSVKKGSKSQARTDYRCTIAKHQQDSCNNSVFWPDNSNTNILAKIINKTRLISARIMSGKTLLKFWPENRVEKQ